MATKCLERCKKIWKIFRPKMTVMDNKHEQGLLQFFGDAEVVQQFKKLKTTEQKIEFMWKVPSLQVGYYSLKIKLNNTD